MARATRHGWSVVGVIGGLNQGGCYPWTSYSPPFGASSAAVRTVKLTELAAGETSSHLLAVTVAAPDLPGDAGPIEPSEQPNFQSGLT